MKRWCYVSFFICLASSLFLRGETWTAPEDLSFAGSDATLPKVSLNDVSEAAAVWIQNGVIQVSTSTFGGSWAAATALQSVYGETALNSCVRINNKSEVVAGWGGNFVSPPYGGVFTCSNLFGQSWNSVIAAYLVQYNTLPHFALHDCHSMVVIENQNLPDEIKGSHYHFGIRWTPAVKISADGNQANHASVAINEVGYTLAAWEEGVVERRIMGGVTLLEDGWGYFYPQYGRQLSATGQNAETPHVAFNNDNNGVVVWRRFDGINWIIQTEVMKVGPEWPIFSSLSATGGDASDPRVAMNHSGQVVAVWTRSNGANDIIQAATMTLGGSWSTPVDLSASGQHAAHPRVEINAAGQVVAIWRRSNGTNTIVQAATLNFGQSWSAPVDLSQTGQNADSPAITLNAKGETLAIWQRSDGTNIRIQYASTRIAPSPPSGLMGKQMGLLAGTQISFFNRLFWTASSTLNVVSYNIYRNGVFIQNTGSRHSQYEDLNQQEGVFVTYEISAVSSGGGESAKVSIIVP